MLPRIRTLKALPIGVDLGYTRVKMAQIRSSGAGLELQAAASAEIPPQYRDDLPDRLQFQADRIKLLLRDTAFSRRRAILSLPAEAVFLHPIRVPAAPDGDIDNVVRSKVRDMLPFPEEDAVVRHIPADTVCVDQKETQERIVVAVCNEKLRPYLTMATRAGLDTVGVNVEVCALAECFTRFFRRATDVSRTMLFVDIGSASTQVVMTQGGRIIFARNVAVGGLSLDRAVAKALNVTVPQAQRVRREMAGDDGGGATEAAEDDLYRLLGSKIEDITDEIIQCLHYCESVFNRQIIDRVLFLGGEANNKRLCKSIASQLNLPAQVGDPMLGIHRPVTMAMGTGPDLRSPCPEWAVAIGLSLGAEAPE